ncbi:MAG: hypothetical protein MZW92_47020 [Comamonadaceae bacterium]|nr:hypothetical protein [Comamonadaceae bacterium]
MPVFGAATLITLVPYLYWNRRHFGDPVFPLTHARRIVTEWAATNPLDIYVAGLWTVFPAALLAFAAAGLIAIGGDASRTWRRHPQPTARLAALRNEASLRHGLALPVWVAYRLLRLHGRHPAQGSALPVLPLAIPVIMIAALAFDRLFRLVCVCLRPGSRLAALAIGGALLLTAFAPTFQRLGQPWVDDSEWEAVKIAQASCVRHLRRSDVIYAAHEFPVLAFYSSRIMAPLPVQEVLDRRRRHYMNRPGLLVHYHPETLGETHGLTSRFEPDQAFVVRPPRQLPAGPALPRRQHLSLPARRAAALTACRGAESPKENGRDLHPARPLPHCAALRRREAFREIRHQRTRVVAVASSLSRVAPSAMVAVQVTVPL